jgi:hypothetical protein
MSAAISAAAEDPLSAPAGVCLRDTDCVDLAAKLQIKPGMTVSVVGTSPDTPDLSELGPRAAGPSEAAAVVAFLRLAAELSGTAAPAIAAARDDRLAWIAYPKAGQLGTDVNRDSLARSVAGLGVQPVRQVSIDAVWSALRFRPAG